MDVNYSSGKVVIFVANRGFALVGSRGGIIKKFLLEGWTVVVASKRDECSAVLESWGVVFEEVLFKRGGFDVRVDYRAYKRLCDIFRRWKPELVHNFHAKPMILCGLAGIRFLPSSTVVVNTVTGLGSFLELSGASKYLVYFGYRLAVSRSSTTIFQNPDDMQIFLKKKWINHLNSQLIVSSGVDLNKFRFVDRSNRVHEDITVVMLARLLRQKGVMEFIEVAQAVRKQFPDVSFVIAGENDSVHPDAISASYIDRYNDVVYAGHVDDVTDILHKCDIFLFPSFYREGVPRVVLEAAAMGLPSVCFDVVGVNQAVMNESTGFLVKVHDVAALTDRVIQLIGDNSLRIQMGYNARRFIEDNFNIIDIEKKYFMVYRRNGLLI